MSALNLSPTDETSLLLGRMALGYPAIRDLPPLDFDAFYQQSQTLRYTTEAEDWPELDRLADEIGGKSQLTMARILHALEILQQYKLDLQRVHTLTAAEEDPPPPDLQFDQDQLRDHYHHMLLLSSDALLASVYASFNQHLGRPDVQSVAGQSEEAFRNEIAALDAFCQNHLRAVHGLLQQEAWEPLRAQLATAASRTAPRVVFAASLAAALYYSLEAPYAAPDARQGRKWAAQVAVDLHETMRWLILLHTAAHYLLFPVTLAQVSGADPGLAAAARRLPYDLALTDGSNVTVKKLRQTPEKYEGKLVEIEGLVYHIAYEREGQKVNTYMKVGDMVRGQAEEPGVVVRAHFQDLMSQGLCPGTYVRLSGQYSAATDWAPGESALELHRLTLAGAGSWLNQLIHDLQTWFELYPQNANLYWSMAPQHAKEPPVTIGAAELIAQKVVRIF